VRFRVRGTYRNREGEVTWSEGELSGSADVVEAVRLRALELEGTPYGPPTFPATSDHDHLSVPESAQELILEQVRRATTEVLEGGFSLPDYPGADEHGHPIVNGPGAAKF
jgi:hypothetical protein